MSVMDIAAKRLNLDSVLGFFKRTVSGNKQEPTPIVPEQPKAENLIETPVVRIDCRINSTWSELKANFKPAIKVSLKKDVYTFKRVRESVRSIMQNLKAEKSKPAGRDMDLSYERSNFPRWDLKEARIWELIPVCAVKKLQDSKKLALPRNIHFSQLKNLVRSNVGSFKKIAAPVNQKLLDYRPPIGTFGGSVAS